jgi:hypothetical protein
MIAALLNGIAVVTLLCGGTEWQMKSTGTRKTKFTEKIGIDLEQPVAKETVAKARSALEAEGVVFIERGAYVGGVVPPAGAR